MTSSRLIFPLIAASWLLAACAGDGARQRGGLVAPGGHAYVDPAVLEALDEAPDCCQTLADLPYRPLAAHGQFTTTLAVDSPAFDFETGKSFFAAYALGGLTRPFTLEIASRVPEADAKAGPRPLIAPTALILDSEHRLIRQIDSDASPAICLAGDRGAAYSLRWRADDRDAGAAYLVLLTTEETRNSGRQLLCGVVHHGLSPVGELAIGSYDDRYGMGEESAISVHARRHGPSTAAAGAEPGVLLVGKTAVRYLERTLVGFRPALAIPFARIDFAHTSEGAAWKRAGRHLRIGYRETASGKPTAIEFEPVATGAEPTLFADQIAAEIRARIPADGAPRR